MYLTANDWALIIDKASRQSFKAGQPIVQRGKRTHGLYLLSKGTASAQIPSQGPSRRIEAGEVIGEISFLDELPATANVVAGDPVDALFIDRPTLQSLFELFPRSRLEVLPVHGCDLVASSAEMIGPAPSAVQVAPTPAAAATTKKSAWAGTTRDCASLSPACLEQHIPLQVDEQAASV